MNDSHFRKFTIATLAVVLGGCMHGNGITKPDTDQTSVAGSSICQEIMLVGGKSTDKEGAHFYNGHRFELIGPLKPKGNYQVWVLPETPKETVDPDMYIAENQLSWTPGMKSTNFKIKDHVPVKDPDTIPPHTDYEPHEYIMVLEYYDDGCPGYAEFKSGAHPEIMGPNHPGHGGASRQ